MCVGGDAPRATVSTCGEQHRLRTKYVERTVGDLVPNNARAAPALVCLAAFKDQIDNVILVVKLDPRLDALLVERLQDHVPSAICGVAAASNRAFTIVARMSTEATLIDLAVGGAIEWQAHALKFNYGRNCLTREHLGRILVGEVVATLDGVEHVPLPVVLFNVSERGANATLRSTGMRAGRIELRQYCSGNPFARQLERRPESGAACAHHDRVNVDLPNLCS